MIDIPSIWQNVIPYLPFFIVGLFVTILSIPVVARIARKLGAVDLPAHMRQRTDKTAERRIHDNPVPKLTVVSLALSILVGYLAFPELRNLPWGIPAGIAIMTVAAILDDKYNLSGKQQLLFQFFAATAVVISGISVTFIQVAGVEIDLVSWSQKIFELGPISYQLLFPADIITILWIVALVNFVGWVDGIDGVHGALIIVACSVLLLIALHSPGANSTLIILIMIFLGANVGFYGYNFPPAKMFYSAATMLTGFLIAVISIMSTSKFAVSIIVLGLPIFDAILVIAMRIKSNPEVLRNPLKILNISDKNHLHFRLLDVGYSRKTVLLIELSIILGLSLVAFFFSGFEDDSLAIVFGILLMVVVFTLIAIVRKKAQSIASAKVEQAKEQPQVDVVYLSPESKGQMEKFTY